MWSDPHLGTNAGNRGGGVRVDFNAVLLIAGVPGDGLWLELCAC